MSMSRQNRNVNSSIHAIQEKKKNVIWTPSELNKRFNFNSPQLNTEYLLKEVLLRFNEIDD